MASTTSTLFRSGNFLEDSLAESPNPKPTPADKARFGKLASLYTAFSVDFASYALHVCLSEGHKVIADPFSGMGTLAEAARPLPLNLLVADISPFATLSGAFRASSSHLVKASAKRLVDLSRDTKGKDEKSIFSEIFACVREEGGSTLGATISSPMGRAHLSTALVIYLASLSRIHLYKDLSGSNPTWVKRPGAFASRVDTLRAITLLSESATKFAQVLPTLHLANRTSAIWSDIGCLSLEDESLDAIVTSPPYPNRTDYIRHYFPAAELLLDTAARDERVVRASQIGTPLIRDAVTERTLPKSVSGLLQQIKTHGSYASERYYHKGFLYYFNDMHAALGRMRTWLRRNGLLMMVVQDTYYKDIHVQTAELLVDIATGMGFKFVGRRDWQVSQRLSRLSPHSRLRLPNRRLNETAVLLSK